MPTSEKQKAANRRNAKKSTGPTSPEGKAAASRNAIKHGLHACDIILKSPQPFDCAQGDISRARSARNPFMGAETARINRQLEDTADDIARAGWQPQTRFGGDSRVSRQGLRWPPAANPRRRTPYKRRLDAGSRSGMTAGSRHDSTCARSARNPFMGVSAANSPVPSSCCTSCSTRINPIPRLTPPEKYFFRETNAFRMHPLDRAIQPHAERSRSMNIISSVLYPSTPLRATW